MAAGVSLKRWSCSSTSQQHPGSWTAAHPRVCDKSGIFVVPIMTLAFPGAWSWPAAGDDNSGLWVVGALYIFVGMVVGVAMVSGTTAAVCVADRVTVVGVKARS